MSEQSAFDDEVLKLENQLAESQKELHDLFQLNSGLREENRTKDAAIARCELLLEQIQGKCSAEYEQIIFEERILVEKVEFEALTEMKYLSNLKIETDKLNSVEAESRKLKYSIDKTSKMLSNISSKHANSLHRINKDVRDYREEIESIMKKELIRVDRNYLNLAYDNLEHGKKSSLLKLSMIEDEIALQNIGQANLNSRYSRQEKKHLEYCRKMEAVKIVSEQIKCRLEKLYLIRKKLNNISESILSNIESILKFKNEIASDLNSLANSYDTQSYKSKENKSLSYSNLENILAKEFEDAKIELLVLSNFSSKLKDADNLYHSLINNFMFANLFQIDLSTFPVNNNFPTWEGALKGGAEYSLNCLKEICVKHNTLMCLFESTASGRLEAIAEGLQAQIMASNKLSSLEEMKNSVDSVVLWAIFHLRDVWTSKTCDRVLLTDSNLIRFVPRELSTISQKKLSSLETFQKIFDQYRLDLSSIADNVSDLGMSEDMNKDQSVSFGSLPEIPFSHVTKHTDIKENHCLCDPHLIESSNMDKVLEYENSSVCSSLSEAEISTSSISEYFSNSENLTKPVKVNNSYVSVMRSGSKLSANGASGRKSKTQIPPRATKLQFDPLMSDRRRIPGIVS